MTGYPAGLFGALSWFDRIAQPARWSFGFPVAAPIRVLWADTGWRERLDLPVALDGYRAAMTACLGLEPRPAAEVVAAAHQLVAGTVTIVRPYAVELAAAAGPDFAAALTDGRLDRYIAQLARALPDSHGASATEMIDMNLNFL